MTNPGTVLQGLAASPGWGIATAHVLSAHALTVPHHHIGCEDIESQQAVLRSAFATVHAQLDALITNSKHAEITALLDVHQQMLGDPVLCDAAIDYIANQRVNAAWALSEQVQQLALVFEAMDDTYLQERALDVRQVGQRVLYQLLNPMQGVSGELLGIDSRNPAVSDDKPIVLVAQDLAPADFAQWQHVRLAGLVTELGGLSSHTAIVARSHGIAAVLGIAQAASHINDGDLIALNGSTGQVWVNPGAELLADLLAQQTAWSAQQAAALMRQGEPAVTQCGLAVAILGNIEHPSDMPAVLAAGLDGVGLFRSEFLFMGRGTLPSEDEQYEAYRAVVLTLQGKTATIRTLDVGADKLLMTQQTTQQLQRHQHGGHAPSINPALGLRAVRYCLAHPDLFLTQLRALLRAAAHGSVQVMLPMIASASELLACKQLLAQAHKDLQDKNVPQGAIKLGMMVEIPAAAIAIDTLLPHIDFCSVGTNDLIQYTLAIDRNDAAVAALYEPCHPAVTALLSGVFAACKAAGKPVAVCGEMAGDAQYTHHLLSLGLRQFSVNPSQAAAVKAAVRQWRAHRCDV